MATKATTKKATSKKAQVKKAAPKKEAAKKVVTKKQPAKEAPAKKQIVKKAPAKKSPAKKDENAPSKKDAIKKMLSDSGFKSIEVVGADSEKLNSVKDKFGVNSKEFRDAIIEIVKKTNPELNVIENNNERTLSGKEESPLIRDIKAREFEEPEGEIKKSATEVIGDCVDEFMQCECDAIEVIDALELVRTALINKVEKDQLEDQNALNSRMSNLKFRKK